MTTTTSGRPLRADALRNRERILTAAATVFARHGLASTLDQVADEAGVGVGTVYRRFSGREELVALVFEQRLTTIADRLEQASRAGDVWTALVETCERVVEEMIADRALRQLVESVFAPTIADLAEVHDRLQAAGEVLVRRGAAQGSIRPDAQGLDVGIMTRCVVAAADMIEGDGWRRYLALMLDGLRATGAGASVLPPATVAGLVRPSP